MYWRWMGSHFLSLVAYGYEVLGGILIFYSSAVTESSMPEDRKKVTHWIMFGVLAAVYIAFGVGLRYVEIQQSSTISQHADEDRRELRAWTTFSLPFRLYIFRWHRFLPT